MYVSDPKADRKGDDPGYEKRWNSPSRDRNCPENADAIDGKCNMSHDRLVTTTLQQH